MILGGLRPCSFIDYPGRLAAVAFAQGCNLRCRYCHNPALVAPRAAAPEDAPTDEETLRLLARRRGALGGLVVSGGEPTLQDGLASFLEQAKGLGFAVKLDTNGTRPDVVERLLARGLVDHLAVDVKATPEDAAWLCGSADQPRNARRCLELARDAGIAGEARTTVVAPLHDAARLEALAEFAAPAERWFLQRFRPGGHLDQDAELRPPDDATLERVVAFAGRRGLEARIR